MYYQRERAREREEREREREREKENKTIHTRELLWLQFHFTIFTCISIILLRSVGYGKMKKKQQNILLFETGVKLKK